MSTARDTAQAGQEDDELVAEIEEINRLIVASEAEIERHHNAGTLTSAKLTDLKLPITDRLISLYGRLAEATL